MASQIEQTVASLAVLSQQYSSELEAFFKKSDDWFQRFSSSTFANFESSLREIESDVARHPSPAKSLRKKVRRKGGKAPRTRKNKNKSNPRSPVFKTSAQRDHTPRIRTKSVPVSSPSRQLRNNERPRTELEAPSSNLPTSPQQPALEVPQGRLAERPAGKEESKRLCSSAITKKHSNGTSRSTGSFHSAVGAGNVPESPSQESQWEDCRSKSESVLHEPATHTTKCGTSELDDGDSVERGPSSSDPSVKHDAIPKSKAFRKDQDADQIDEVSGTPNFDETSDGTLQSPEETDIRKNETPGKIHDVVDMDTMDASSEEEPSDTANLNDISGFNHAQSETDDEEMASSDAPYTALSAALQRKRKDENSESSTFKKKDIVISEPPESEKELESDKVLPRPPTGDQFEFKAPKPRSIPGGQSSHSTQQPIRSASDLQPLFNQTSAQTVKRDFRMEENKQNLYQKHFAVDQGGKINETGIGLLSEIASTPATAAKRNESDALNNHEEQRTRGTKLFKPNDDIYSAQRKPALSRVLSVQKSTLTSRGSLLSHTPGAHAPSTRLARDSTLSGVFTNSLRESLAALKQPITDRNPGHASGDDEPPLEGTQGSQGSVFLPGKEQKPLDVPVGKRLTFADEYKLQFEGTLPQFSRGSEPQTAPTKEFRQPRIRRETEKSALRRRIEEIRGKASSLSVMKQASPRPSSSNSTVDNLPKRGETSNASGADSALETGSDILERSNKSGRTSAVSVEVEKVTTKMSLETTSNDSRGRDSFTSGSAENENSEYCDTNSPPKEKEEEGCSTAEREITENDSIEVIDVEDEDGKETGKEDERDAAQEDRGPKNILSNLMTSASSMYTGLSILGTRTHEEKRGDADSEQAAKRQRLDAERREAERLARMEAQRAARQREAEEKQRRAEARRQRLAEAEKAKEEERKRKEVHRKKVKQQEEEERRRKKMEEDKKKEERRRQVLEKRAMNLELQGKRKGVDSKRQRQLKIGDRGMSGIPKPNGVGGKCGKGYGGGKHLGRHGSPGMRVEDEKEMNSYDMTPAKATVIEESDEETERRKGKTVPDWAGERNLAISARSQPDPDKVFVNMPMCNLRDVFGNQKQYRTRSSSANWTQDRVTSSEMTRYKKAVGGFRDV